MGNVENSKITNVENSKMVNVEISKMVNVENSKMANVENSKSYTFELFCINLYLHSMNPTLQSFTLAVFRCVWNVSDLDTANTVFMLSRNDPLTTLDYYHILQHYKQAAVVLDSGTHGHWKMHFQKLRHYLI